MLPFLVREVLLRWLRSFVGKKRKKVWLVVPLMPFLNSLEGKKW